MLVPLIGAGVSLLTNSANNMANQINNHRNAMYQRIENEANRQFSLDMWNRNNEYNTPVNQMKRLNEAGINPHLAYANGQPMNVSNAPAQAVQGQAPRMNANRYDMDIIGLLNAATLQKQIEKTDAEIGNIKAQTDKVKEETVGTKIDNEYKPRMNESVLTTQEVQQKLGLSQIQVNDQQILESEDRILTNATLRRKMESEIRLTNAQTNVAIKTLSVMDATIRKIYSDIWLNKIQGSNIEANTRLTNELVKEKQRGNYIGDKFDLSMADAQTQIALKEARARSEKLFKEIGLTDTQIKQLEQIMFWDNFHNTTNAVGDVLSGATKAGNFGRILKGQLKGQ